LNSQIHIFRTSTATQCTVIIISHHNKVQKRSIRRSHLLLWLCGS